MNDRPDSTASPVPKWRDPLPFRETFLTLLPPDLRGDARRLGAWAYGQLVEAHDWTRDPETVVERELRAASLDLANLAGYVAHIGAEYRDGSDSPRDAELSILAERIAPQLSALADSLSAALSP